MKVQVDTSQAKSGSFPDVSSHLTVYHKDVTENIDSPKRFVFQSSIALSELPNGASASGSMVDNTSHSEWNDLHIRDELRVVSEDSRALSEVCLQNASSDDDDLSYEVQQAYRIFHDFLLEKHKAITAPLWNPVGIQDNSLADSVQQGMCFKRIDEKFVNREYDSITDFVADFRLMLENCYRFHGVDHWISRQAQKLEIILEQKLTLLSRVLREKTSLAVTSKGRFGTEDEKGLVGSSSRRRSTPRSLVSVTLGGSESIMVQALRLEEQQRAKEEKRQREQEKREAEEASAKEVVEWEQNLLSQAAPWPVDTLWELPAIGHFLCLAQTALNLPEIIFFELERCLLMPRCSSFLAKIMTSLLSQPYRRSTIHRRPPLTYRRWEAELRQRVLGWYHSIGQAENQAARAEQLGLCNQFFQTLGETSPLEEAAFHLLPFYQRVWLLKGLCDNIYETQKEVQDAVLGQPIHECRESILGYDSHENAYIHFPHFCGADLRIYCQSPCTAPDVPPNLICVRKVNSNRPAKTSLPFDDMMVSTASEEKCDYEKQRGFCFREGGKERIACRDEVNCVGKCKVEAEQKRHSAFLFSCRTDTCVSWATKGEPGGVVNRLQLTRDAEPSSESEPQLQEGNCCFKGKSSSNFSITEFQEGLIKPGNVCSQANLLLVRGQDPCSECSRTAEMKSEYTSCSCSKIQLASQTSRLHEQANQQQMHTKKKRKKKTITELRTKGCRGKTGSVRIGQVIAAKSTLRKAACTIKKKDKRKKRKLGKKFKSRNMATKKKKEVLALPLEPTFKLVCTSLEELRELISKIEDEMDELESTKKKSGRWHYRREAVKELHITLIRLLNELSPWEPKLIRAFQKNRVRLKKDYDDFRKHPEYDVFVREELLVEEEELRPLKCVNFPMDFPTETDENDKEEKPGDIAVDGPQQLVAEMMGNISTVRRDLFPLTEYQPSIHRSKRRTCNIEEDPNQNKKIKVSTEDSAIFCNKMKDNPRNENSTTPNHQFSETNPTLNIPMTGVHRSYKPIQALLAKSVGNKVTLIKQTPAKAIHHMSQDESKVSPLAQANKLTQTPQTELPKAAPSIRLPITSKSATVPRSPLHMVYKVPGGLGLIKRDGSPLKFTVQPVMDQKNGEKIMPKVVILPTNMLIKKSENCDSREQEGSPGCKTSFINTPGFNVPVQHVAPLKDSQEKRVHSPSVSLNLHTPSTLTLQGNRPLKVANSNRSHLGFSTDPSPSEADDVRQELKTVCIRDSQSILVTTRGGNTGVVKVQTSDTPGTLAANPVFTLSPQFQALLVSTSSPSVAVPLSAEHRASTTVSQPSTLTFTSPCIANPANASLSSSSITSQSVSSNCIIPVISQANVNTLISAETLQITQNKCVIQAHPEHRVTDRIPFKKIFLVNPSTGDSSKNTMHSNVTSVPQGSRLMFISQKSGSSLSPVIIPKQTVFPESTTAGSTAVSNAESINQSLNHTDGSSVITEDPGLPRRLHTLLSTDSPVSSSKLRLSEVSTNSFLDCVSRASATSSSSFVFAQSATSGSLKANATRKAHSDLSKSPPLVLTAVPSELSSELKNAHSSVVPISVPSLCKTAVQSSINLKNKDLGLLAGSHIPSPASTQSPLKSSPVIPFRVVPPLSVGRSTMVQTVNSVVSQTTSSIRPSAEPKSSTTPMHQKIVINTTAPLAPGTQILINNARFVVPAQGLGPGSHVLLISSPLSASEPRQSANLTKTPPPAGASVPVSMSVLPSLQGHRVLTSITQSPHAMLKLPASTAVKLGQLGPVPVALCPPATPLRTSSSSTAHIPHLLRAAVSTGKQNMSSALKFPSLLTSEGNLSTTTSIQVLANSVPQMSTAPSQIQGSPFSTTKQSHFHAASVSTSPKPHLVSMVAPFGTVTSVSTTVIMPFASSSTSRMQAMPVATVRPIGSSFNKRQATPITTVSPSSSTVIMAPCQPISNVTSKSVPVSVVLANSSQDEGNTSIQISASSALTSLSHNRLMVSPDGAILNTITNPALATIPTVPTVANSLALTTLGVLRQPTQKM
ncbi:uncharacterized protein KIAA2026 isoform X1 [Alosa sapidissima]|uniref:uncharacterized protein KIAA2026 isoform X1 n=1 Tax=Alosa sapidissima TaxID=34773 RepID=UPI001C088021|nr:uncharacterized protein KIAA2026 isoform X1 [Alosa sapidissima]